MKNNYVVGNVIKVDGLKIDVLMNDQSNLESFHFDGEMYDGISIGSYVGIIRGSNKIVARVEKEFLEDIIKDPSKQEYMQNRFERHLEVHLIGNFYDKKFSFGIQRFPMIYNEVVLLTENEIKQVLQKDSVLSKHTLSIGTYVSNNIEVNLAWDKIFNTHIGIFGNTGSGKSNTLTKLYSELFLKEGSEIIKSFNNKSIFVFLDFNGEYTQDNIFSNNKKIIKLSTDKAQGLDKILLKPRSFWDIETLSILYSATEKTQKPFLKGAVDFFLDKEKYDITSEKLINGMCLAFSNVFNANNNKESLSLLNKCIEIIGIDVHDDKTEALEEIDVSWLDCLWHSSSNTYYYINKNDDKKEAVYINNKTKDEIQEQRIQFENLLQIHDVNSQIDKLSLTKKLQIAVNCHLIFCLSYGKVNFDYISPLIHRIETKSKFIEKTIDLSASEDNWNPINIISLRSCNSEAKKMIPLLIAKELYDDHKKKIEDDTEVNNTVHLIIDEAHNILSFQSKREEESWKDYRLEVFEEIIKEGRKFGFFITLASQRPYDISPTIISQLHNYFIHRLVNEQDLKMIANSVNSLDSLSKSQIPSLAPGQCIITGTSFEMPLLVQVEKLSKDKSPTSENADLVKMWTKQDSESEDSFIGF